MVEVPNRILFSEMKHVTVSTTQILAFLINVYICNSSVKQVMLTCTYAPCVFQRGGDLADMITRVIREGLEGLVLKDVKVSFIFQW